MGTASAPAPLLAPLPVCAEPPRPQPTPRCAEPQVIDNACDSAIDQADQPLNLWAIVERCAPGRARARALPGRVHAAGAQPCRARAPSLTLLACTVTQGDSLPGCSCMAGAVAHTQWWRAQGETYR